MLYTLVRLKQDNIKCRGDETPLRGAKRMAISEFHNWYPDEPIMGCTIIEIDSANKELVLKLVWG
jgi:hypothetical protein